MRITSRGKTIAFFITLGACLVALAVFLNVSWVVYHWRSVVPLVLGIVFFGVIIPGLVVNTIFIVREIRRNERHDTFLNAVTHELKTPITSIRLYLETLQRRALSEEQRQQFYDVMLSDSERLLATVEQVLKAGEVGQRARDQIQTEVDMRALVEQCIETTRLRHHLGKESIVFENDTGPLMVRGNPDDLETAVQNVLGNAVKYSPDGLHAVVRLAVESDAWIVLSVSDEGIGIP